MSRPSFSGVEKPFVLTVESIAQINAAILSWSHALGFRCFYQTEPACFQTFDELFPGYGLDEKQKTFLIEHGLPEASVASFFFINAVTEGGGIIFDDHVTHSFRLNVDLCDYTFSLEGVSQRDISYFPYLRDSPFSMCSRFFDGNYQVKWFQDNLDKDPVFWRHCVLAALPITLTPTQYIYDLFYKFVTDKMVASTMAAYFTYRRNHFLAALEKSNRFLPVYEKISRDELSLMVRVMSKEMDVASVVALLKAQVKERVALQIESIFIDLQNLMDMSAKGSVSRGVYRESVQSYVPLVGFYASLFKEATAFFDAELSDAEVFVFFHKVNGLVLALKSLTLEVSQLINQALNAILDKIKSVLFQLQAPFFDRFDEVLPSAVHPVNQDLSIDRLTPSVLSENIVFWIKAEDEIGNRLRNKAIIIQYFEYFYGAYEQHQDTYVGQASTAVLSAVAYTTSFFRRAPVAQVQSVKHDLTYFRERLYASEKPDALFLVLSQLFSLEGKGIDAIHSKFVVELMKQYQRDYAAKKVFFAAVHNPFVTRDFVRFQRECVVEAGLVPAAEDFIRKTRPYLTDHLDWVAVDHTASVLLSGRLAPAPLVSTSVSFGQMTAPFSAEPFGTDDDFSAVLKEGGDFHPV